MTYALPLPDHVLAARDLSGFGELDVLYRVSGGASSGTSVATGVVYGTWSGVGEIEPLVYGEWDGVAAPRNANYGRWTDG